MTIIGLFSLRKEKISFIHRKALWEMNRLKKHTHLICPALQRLSDFNIIILSTM